MMPSLSRGAPRHHHQLHSGTRRRRRREPMFDWEWSGPNEPQAEVRRGVPGALPSDYRSQTHLPRAHSSGAWFWCVCAPPPDLSGLRGNITSLHHKDTRSVRAASVMRSGENQSQRGGSAALRRAGKEAAERRRRGMKRCRRRPQTGDS